MTCISINDKLDLSWLINSLLYFDANELADNRTIYFNISIHAPFEILNRALFCLFICGSLKDDHSGLIFALPMIKPWKFVIEIPYSNITHFSVQDNFHQILPILSIISSNPEEITNENYPLAIGVEEEIVARFLKAFKENQIDRKSRTNLRGEDEEVKFEPIGNLDESRLEIEERIRKDAAYLMNNKIDQLSFTKFLHRRVRFFLGSFYRYNQTIEKLGSIAIQQMIKEAVDLTRISFETNSFPRIYLLYDPFFSLRLLHTGWEQVSDDLKTLLGNRNSSQNTDTNYLVECLSWLIDIPPNAFADIVKNQKFILTENFTYKLFHVHERQLTKLALIIEGDTGVGKTFLLTFYSMLLNCADRRQTARNNLLPKIVEHSSAFLHEIINDTLEKDPEWLKQFINRINPPSNNADAQNDAPADIEFLTKTKLSLTNKTEKMEGLDKLWKAIVETSSEQAIDTRPKLVKALHDYVTKELVDYPLIDASLRLTTLLQTTNTSNVNISIEIFKEYLFSKTKSFFYRLLLHPGITEERIIEFMSPISQLARHVPQIELVVFFDEVNTSSCLGLFKEMFMDRTLHGKLLPKNIFFTAAINPLSKSREQIRIHRMDYIVHQLPQSLEHLKVIYGPLESHTLSDYIDKKFQMIDPDSSSEKNSALIPRDRFRKPLQEAISIAHAFCKNKLGK